MVTTRMFELRCADGTVAIVSMPVYEGKPYSEARLQQAIDNHHVEVLGWREITAQDLPRKDGKPDRRFRDAWTSDGSKINHDMDKVRAIHVARLEFDRAKEIEALRDKIEAAQDDEDDAEVARLRARRKALRRPLPESLDAKLKAAKTVNAVAAIKLDDIE